MPAKPTSTAGPIHRPPGSRLSPPIRTAAHTGSTDQQVARVRGATTADERRDPHDGDDEPGQREPPRQHRRPRRPTPPSDRPQPPQPGQCHQARADHQTRADLGVARAEDDPPGPDRYVGPKRAPQVLPRADQEGRVSEQVPRRPLRVPAELLLEVRRPREIAVEIDVAGVEPASCQRRDQGDQQRSTERGADRDRWRREPPTRRRPTRRVGATSCASAPPPHRGRRWRSSVTPMVRRARPAA